MLWLLLVLRLLLILNRLLLVLNRLLLVLNWLLLILNRLLLIRGGSEAVAAYAVISTLGNAANCTTTGIGGVTLTGNKTLHDLGAAPEEAVGANTRSPAAASRPATWRPE